MNKIILSILLVVISFNAHSKNCDEKIKSGYDKVNAKFEQLSPKDLNNILNDFNRHFKKINNKTLSLKEKNMLKDAYIYLKRQRVTDPVLKKARDKTIHIIEKSGKLK